MRKHWVVIGVFGWMVAGATGQILPPAPPKTEPTPEYTPPPPPPAPTPVGPKTAPGAPPTAPAPDEPLPSLIERDAEGKVKMLALPAEEAAIRALKPNEETMKKVETSLAGRRDDLDRLVVENVEALVELKKFAAEVSEKSSMDEIQTKAKKVHAFRTFTGVLDRLSREGAIDPILKSRAAKVADEYRKALAADLTKGFEHGNTQQMVLLGFRQFLAANTTEAYASLDRQLAAAAPKMETLLGGLPLSAEMKAGVASKTRGLPKAGNADADAKRLEALKGVFYDVLGADERQAFLKAANPKLFEGKPTGEKDPAAPATDKK